MSRPLQYGLSTAGTAEPCFGSRGVEPASQLLIQPSWTPMTSPAAAPVGAEAATACCEQAASRPAPMRAAREPDTSRRANGFFGREPLEFVGHEPLEMCSMPPLCGKSRNGQTRDSRTVAAITTGSGIPFRLSGLNCGNIRPGGTRMGSGWDGNGRLGPELVGRRVLGPDADRSADAEVVLVRVQAHAAGPAEQRIRSAARADDLVPVAEIPHFVARGITVP